MGCDFSFVHCADLHLGSRFKGLNQSNSELGKSLYKSTFNSFSKIIDIAKEKADFMVISGDIYDELVETPRTRSFFAEELKRLGKECFIVTGNHDFKHEWSDSIPYPDNVHVFGTEPDAYKLNIRGKYVEIIGVSYNGPHTNENLVSKLKGSPGIFTIGVVHCSVSSMGAGDGYAPCSEDDFKGKGVDYWALGHIHKRTILCECDPAIVYPGNIQGRDVNESGDKGCMLVKVSGSHPEIEFVPTHDVLWSDLVVDISGIQTINQLLESVKVRIPKRSIVSLELTGRGTLNKTIRRSPNVITENLSSSTGSTVIIRRLTCVDEIDLDKAREGETLISEVLKASDDLSQKTDQELLNLICSSGPAEDLRPYLQYYADKGKLKELLNEATTSVIDRLTGVKS